MKGQAPGADDAGLRFACVAGCTNCCDQSGYVYLTSADVNRAAGFLGMSRRAFLRRYVYRTRNLYRLRKPPGSQCHFLREGGCSIHPAKPVQCRLYPFWPELVEDRAAWRRTARFCPGIGQGPLIQIGAAVEAAGEMRSAYPTLY
jgi:Fe-S-cluster containining protein